MRPIHYIAVHHSASPIGTTAQDISDWHTLPPPLGRGWRLGTGYHRVIEADGLPYDGRKLQRRGAHARRDNANSIGICVIGDNTVSGREWTLRQEETLHAMLLYYHAIYPQALVCGHRDLPHAATLCPGLDIAEWCYNRELEIPLLKGIAT